MLKSQPLKSIITLSLLMCVSLHAGWEDDTQVTTAGETIELNCTEEFPVHWCYPRVYSDECMVC
jgi:hypothetical protein